MRLETLLLLCSLKEHICVELKLQPVHNSDEFHLTTSNTQEEGHLEIAANGFWVVNQKSECLDLQSLCSPNCSSSLSSTFKKHKISEVMDMASMA